MDDPALLAAQADQALASGNRAKAQGLLERLAEGAPDFSNWMKLGALRRASGDFGAALEAVNAALAIAPLDFMALLSKAAILERLGDPSADEAYGRALVQIPDEPLPPQIQQMADHGRRKYDAHMARRDALLVEALKPAIDAATPEERGRIDRFRSNAMRTTRPYHCEPTHFHYPGLVEREFHDRRHFPWLEPLEAATDAIAEELDAVLQGERAELVPYIRYAAHEPLRQWRELNNSRDWTAIHLFRNGRRIEANARYCPRTMALLEQIPQPDIHGCSPNAMFSLLAPRTTIPAHHGIANTRLVCHLPLIVPAGCWFRVGAETRFWERGKAFVFDDTIEHEAANPSDDLRVVLIVDLWHPGLSETEREAVRLLLEASVEDAALAL